MLNIFDAITLNHITHLHNLSSILKHGLYSHYNQYKKVDISNTNVNKRRKAKENIYGRKIQEYVPFYFNPRNAMMYKNKNENVIILTFDNKLLLRENVIFSDQNASTKNVKFYKNLNDLSKIVWNEVFSRTWNDKNLIVKQRMMAEILIYKYVSISYLRKIYCKDYQTKKELLNNYFFQNISIIVKPDLFFIKKRYR